MNNEKSQLVGQQEPRFCGLMDRQRSVINSIEDLVGRIARSAERLDGEYEPKDPGEALESPSDPAIASRICNHNGDLENLESKLGVLAERFESLV